MKHMIKWLSIALMGAAFSACANDFYITSVLTRDSQRLGPQAFNMDGQSSKEFTLSDTESVRYTLHETEDASVYIAVTLIEKNADAESRYTLPSMTMMPSGDVNGVSFQAAEQAPYFDWQISAEPSLPVLFYKQAADQDKGLSLVFKNGLQPVYFDPVPLITESDVDFIRYRKDNGSIVEVELTDAGTKKLQNYTRDHIGSQLGIGVAGEIINAAVIRSEIAGKMQLSVPEKYQRASAAE